MTNRKYGQLAVAALFASLALGTTEASALECGDTILPGQKVRLEANVGPCTDATGGITIVGPAKLDLNGFAVTCQLHTELHRNPPGIRIVGERARVQNGRVVACGTGVQVHGQGRHRVKKVEAALSGRDGFEIDSEGNVLKDNHALRSRDDGFAVLSQRNTLKKNLAADNEGYGIVVGGHSQRIIRNDSIDNVDGGMIVIPHGQGPSRIIRNVLSSPDALDIQASQQACDENVFRRNLFGDASHTCVE